MIRAGHTFANDASGERYTFLQTAADTAGALVELEDRIAPGADGPIPHFHPRQTERFTVRSGRLKVNIASRDHFLGPGESIAAPPGVPHKLMNGGDEELVLVVEMRPALRFAEFLHTAAALTRGPDGGRGRRFNLLEGALLMREYGDEIKPALPPVALQRVLFPLLAFVATRLGYRLPTPPDD